MEPFVRQAAMTRQSVIAAPSLALARLAPGLGETIKGTLTRPKSLFALTLLLATTIPFVVVALQRILPGFIVVSVQEVIFFLGGIHVPLTAYLFFDPKIRAFMRHRPIALIGGPILIFAICFFVFLSSWQSRAAGQAWPVVYFMLGVLAWNNWHFGKQNVGVYSFFRLAQSQPGVVSLERKLIVFGALLGAVGIFAANDGGYLTNFINAYGKNDSFSLLQIVAAHVLSFAMIVRQALLALVGGYPACKWRRSPWMTVMMFFLWPH